MHGFVLCLHCFWIFLFVSLPFSGVWRDSIWAVLFRSCDFPYKLVTSLMDRLLHHMKMLGCKYLLTIDPWFLRKKGIKKAVNYYKREKNMVSQFQHILPSWNVFVGRRTVTIKEIGVCIVISTQGPGRVYSGKISFSTQINYWSSAGVY